MTKSAKEQTHAQSKVLVQLLLPAEVVKRIDAEASREMQSRASFVRGAVRSALDRREKADAGK